jgi:hypothetical protein
MNAKRLFDDDDVLFGESPDDDRPSHVEIRRDAQESGNASANDEPPATNPDFPVARNYFECIPLLALGARELAAMPLDHREGFLLSMIDGVSSVETILDVCAMPADEALAILESLSLRGVIVIPR